MVLNQITKDSILFCARQSGILRRWKPAHKFAVTHVTPVRTIPIFTSTAAMSKQAQPRKWPFNLPYVRTSVNKGRRVTGEARLVMTRLGQRAANVGNFVMKAVAGLVITYGVYHTLETRPHQGYDSRTVVITPKNANIQGRGPPATFEDPISKPQPCVVSPKKAHALFLWIKVKPLSDPKQVVSSMARLPHYVYQVTGPILPGAPDEVLAGVGFGPELFRMGAGGAPKPFSNEKHHLIKRKEPEDGQGIGGDIFIHAKSHKLQHLMELGKVVLNSLPVDTLEWSESIIATDENMCKAQFIQEGCSPLAAAQDPCTSYTTLNDPWRATTFLPGPDDPLNCDLDLSPGWYRFVGGEMPTTCPASFSCGTQAPVWLQGALPLPGEGLVNRTACAVTNNALGVLTCCGQEITLQLQNCGDFVVYCLYNTPACAMAYCVDMQAAPPVPQPAPVLEGPEVINDSFRFVCRIPEVTGARVSAYDIRWTFDGQVIENVDMVTLTGDVRVTYLNQEAWTGRVGSMLRCSVRARDDVTGQTGDFVDSNGYWGGIRVNPPTLTLSEGQGAQEVTLTSTLPVVCFNDNQCELQVEVDVEGTRWEDIATTDSCLLRMRREDWNATSRTVSVSTHMMATRDFVDDGNQELTVRFRPVFSLAPPLWNGYQPPQMQVLTVDRATRRCSGYADPHVQGFERAGVFHMYEAGDYVFMRSERTNFEVQVRTWPCVGRACICAVAVQKGPDAITLDICDAMGQLPPNIRVISPQDLQPSTTIRREEDGRNFMLAFASGQWVRVTDFQSYLNVEVQVTGLEFESTAGLCGTFDNNTQNEFMAPDGHLFPDSDEPTDFFAAWRIDPDESLFSGVLRPVTDGGSRDTTQLCMCNAASRTIDCGVTRGIMDPARDGPQCDQCDITRDVNRWRLNGGVDDDTEDPDVPVVFLDQAIPNVQPAGTLLPVSRDEANSTCTAAMMNLTLTTQCAGAVTAQLSSFVMSCVEDMLASQDQRFLLAAVASWEGACESDVIRNPNNYVTDDVGRVQPPRVLTTDMCPGQCMMRGRCQDGTCFCDVGFRGQDCTVKGDKPPVILRIIRNGLCEARRRPCRVAFLAVDNFLSTPEMMCRIRDVQMTPQGPVSVSEWRPVPADFYTNRQMACQMPETGVPEDVAVRAYYVSVTTDGQLFSNEALYIVFDAICLDCDVSGNCSVRSDACLIDDRCYTARAPNPLNAALVCDPLISNMRWTSTVASNDAWSPPELCPLRSLTFTRWDVWTSNQTGCPCHFNPAATAVCACCEAGACQCPAPSMHQCVLCGRQDLCGRRQPSPDFGVDGWTQRMTGCACVFDTSRNDCACCQNGGCQCPLQFRNQCVPCGRPEICGSKPDVFGPVLP